MKVYAQIISDNNGFKYRLNTLLHFGNSWDLIGNIVLANPGSAKPKNEISNEDWQSVKDFLQIHPRPSDKSILIQKYWSKFEPDATMRQIETLFSGGYTHTNIKPLNGVIQLFNCFNVKNEKLDEAIKNINQYDANLCFSNNIWDYFYDKPVYFGFSQAVLKEHILREKAEKIFNNTHPKLKRLYKREFDKNQFYHLGYVNRTYKIATYTKEILKPFVESLAQKP